MFRSMKKCKKIIAVLLAVVLAFGLTACVSAGTTATAELTVSEEAPNPDASAYTDDLDGLIQYMTDCQLIAGEGVTMSADYIGAVNGKKFSYKYMDSVMSCELYEFDPDNLNEKAKPVIESIQKEGKFTVLDKEVEAKLSDSGKFVMIFVSQAHEEVHQAFTDRINEKFAAFQGK